LSVWCTGLKCLYDVCCRYGVLVDTVCMMCVVGVVYWLEVFVWCVLSVWCTGWNCLYDVWCNGWNCLYDMCCRCGVLVGTVCMIVLSVWWTGWNCLYDVCCRCGVLVGTVCMMCIVGVVYWLELFVWCVLLVWCTGWNCLYDVYCRCGVLVGTVCMMCVVGVVNWLELFVWYVLSVWCTGWNCLYDVCCRCGVLVGTNSMLVIIISPWRRPEYRPKYVGKKIMNKPSQIILKFALLKLKDNKTVSGLSDTKIYYFIFSLATCFGQLTIIRPSLQTLE